LIGEFYRVFFLSFSPQKPKQKLFQVWSLSQQPPFSLAHSFNKCLCWICVLTRSIVTGYLCFIFVSSNPSRHAHRHAAASRFPFPVLWCSRSKKESNPKKGTKKRENPKEKRDRRTVQVGNGNRFVSVKEFCAVTICHRFVLVEGVFRGVRLRFCHGISCLSCYSPR
jgi:hypothetical protein